MFVVCHAEAGSIFPWGCVILGCIDVWLVQLQNSLKFRNRSYLISWRGFLQGFVVLASFPSTPSHETTKELTALVQTGLELSAMVNFRKAVQLTVNQLFNPNRDLSTGRGGNYLCLTRVYCPFFCCNHCCRGSTCLLY